MVRYFLGILTVFALLVVLVLGIWVGDLIGFWEINKLALSAVSSLPELNDVAQNYELGKKRSDVLKKKEAELQALQERLNQSEAELDKRIKSFEAEKINWERQQLKNSTAKKATATDVAPDDHRKYLAMVGGMKPDKAAVVIRELPVETTILIFNQLRSSQVIKIMENLPAEYVIKLTQSQVNNN